MMYFGGQDQHFWRTQGVARALGLNLTEALSDGRLDRNTYATLVAECQACAHAAACTAWMAGLKSAIGEAPAFCPALPRLNDIAIRG
ncbi:MAG: DUF6455 family protein [Rhodobacter sp.]|nr:DUF6455 family protein [Rhodobacter sp.]